MAKKYEVLVTLKENSLSAEFEDIANKHGATQLEKKENSSDVCVYFSTEDSAQEFISTLQDHPLVDSVDDVIDEVTFDSF